MIRPFAIGLLVASIAGGVGCRMADSAPPSDTDRPDVVERPGRYKPLTEPPCSYCSTQHLTGLIRADDRVVAWLRGPHNGGAVPLRHFLAGPRVINDTYGLFFYDPDGGYVAAYEKDYGFQFHGWRRGVMVVAGSDGSLWSALSGVCIAGPKKGERLKRIASMVSDWGYWMMLHPESTAYNLFDGGTYDVVELPTDLDPIARRAIGDVDGRLPAMSNVLGVEINGKTKAYPLDALGPRAAINDAFAGQPLSVFWHAATRTATAYQSDVPDHSLSFIADSVPPESAPIEDAQTHTRWTMAGRGVDGPLRGAELTWVSSIQCRWYAWAAEYPETDVYEPPAKP